MPVLRCPECGTVVAWRGKSFSFTCPGEHPYRTRPRTLHVDRDGIALNGHAIDAHLGGPGELLTDDYDERLARWAAALAGRELVATNAAKGRQ